MKIKMKGSWVTRLLRKILAQGGREGEIKEKSSGETCDLIKNNLY
jgi:hypothetical protein